MKLSCAALLLAAATLAHTSTASSSSSSSSSSNVMTTMMSSSGKEESSALKKKLLSQAQRRSRRHLDEEDEAEDDNEFLESYSLKFLQCIPGEKIKNERGEYEYNVAIFRLCPNDGSCSYEEGCDSGFGDYVVGLNTFVDSYLEEFRDDRRRRKLEDEEEFNIDEYVECGEWNYNDENENERRTTRKQRQLDQNGGYYIGPACTEDGTGVKLGLFTDYKCTYEAAEGTFESITGGVSLPYSDGDLVLPYCTDCYGKDEDGNYDLKEYCQELYENSGGGCETWMESYSQYGKDTSQCDYIEMLTYVEPEKKGGAGKFFMWVIILGCIGGAFYYFMDQKKKKTTTTTGTADADGKTTGLMS